MHTYWPLFPKQARLAPAAPESLQRVAPWSTKHRSAPKEQSPECSSMLEASYSRAPIETPMGTNTKVTSAKGRFCASPSFVRAMPPCGQRSAPD